MKLHGNAALSWRVGAAWWDTTVGTARLAVALADPASV